MLSIIKSMSLMGLEGYLINVQVDVSAGMPCWEIVGLPDTSVKESKERVKTAIKNSGYELLSRKVVVNLAPADIKKEGSFFDLPIAIGILMCCGEIKNENISDIVFVGELSLDGSINKINGILPMCIEARKLGIKRIIVPLQNIKEASKMLLNYLEEKEKFISSYEIIEEKKFHKIKVEVILRELTKRGLVIEDKILLKDSNNNSILEEIVYAKKIY